MLTKKQLQERKNYIGGSDAGAIAGFCPYRSPLDVYKDKTEDLMEIDKPIYMHWGTMLEPFVREEFERIRDTKVSVINATKFHPKYGCLAANIDGLLSNGELLEIKCTTFWGRKRFEDDNFPLEYICQCAHYATIYNAPKVHMAVFHGIDKPLQLYTYERDKEFEEKLLSTELNFWHNYIEKRIPPEPMTYDEVIKEFNVKRNYMDDLETTCIATENIENIYCDLQKYTEQQKDLEDKIKEKKMVVMKFLEDKERLINRAGEELCTWKFRANNRFDTTKFKKEQPEIYNQYLKQGNCRTFLIK